MIGFMKHARRAVTDEALGYVDRKWIVLGGRKWTELLITDLLCK